MAAFIFSKALGCTENLLGGVIVADILYGKAIVGSFLQEPKYSVSV